MAITNGYCTLAELRERLGHEVTDTTDNAILEAVITAVSRSIDNKCGRFFWQDAAGTRYFTAERNDYLQIPDCYGVTTLKTDDDGDRTYENTWATTDYDLMPFNAGQDTAWPYTWIEPTPNGNYLFTRMRKGIEITANWGWPAVPDPINEGCLLQSARFFKRKDAPFGVAGSARAGGQMTLKQIPLDLDVLTMIMPYVRHN